MVDGIFSYLVVPELAPFIIAIAVVLSGVLAAISKRLNLYKASMGFIRSFILSLASVTSSLLTLFGDFKAWWAELIAPISFLLAIISFVEAMYRVYRKE